MLGTFAKPYFLIISQVPPPIHGSAIATERLIALMKTQGFMPKLIDRRFSRSIAEVGRFRARKLASGVFFLLRVSWGLAQTLIRRRRYSPPVIFFVTNRGLSFVVDVAISALLRCARVQSVYCIHTNGFRALADRGTAVSLLVRFVLRTAGTVVVLSESLVSDVSWAVPQERVHVIPNSVPDPISSTRSERKYKSVTTLLYFSNFIEEKGPLRFVELASALASRGFSGTFILAGAFGSDELMQRLRTAIAESGLGARINLRGPVYASDKWDLLATSDVLIFPSLYRFEAQPISIIEAMATGTPVVAYPVGGIASMLGEGSGGVLVWEPSVGALAQSVWSAIHGGVEWTRKNGCLSRNTYLTTYAPEVVDTLWKRLLLSALSEQVDE